MAMASPATDRPVRDDRVLLITRGLSVAIIPFLVVAFVVLYLWPSDTGRLFAWPIAPPITALILGSVYLGGAYFFVRAARANRWHTIKAGFPPVATFSTLMGITTIVHWDKFTHSHVAFWLWAGLYFTTPFLVAGVWMMNRRLEDRTRSPHEKCVSDTVARFIGAVGVLAVAMSALLFMLPEQALTLWPWILTPLTARVMGAIFALGLAAVGAFSERRWSAIRIMVQVEALMLILILAGGVRAFRDLESLNVLTWAFTAGFASLLIASIVLYAQMEKRN
jgi:hypothetical protein